MKFFSFNYILFSHSIKGGSQRLQKLQTQLRNKLKIKSSSRLHFFLSPSSERTLIPCTKKNRKLLSCFTNLLITYLQYTKEKQILQIHGFFRFWQGRRKHINISCKGCLQHNQHISHYSVFNFLKRNEVFSNLTCKKKRIILIWIIKRLGTLTVLSWRKKLPRQQRFLWGFTSSEKIRKNERRKKQVSCLLLCSFLFSSRLLETKEIVKMVHKYLTSALLRLNESRELFQLFLYLYWWSTEYFFSGEN